MNNSTRKRRLLTAEEYGENLKTLLGKVKDRSGETMDDFREALGHCK